MYTIITHSCVIHYMCIITHSCFYFYHKYFCKWVSSYAPFNFKNFARIIFLKCYVQIDNLVKWA